MSIEINELFDSRKCSLSNEGYTETREYHYKGEGDPSEVLLAISPELGSAHPVFPLCYLLSIDIEPVEALEVLRVTYNYGKRESDGNRNDFSERWTFEQVAQSIQINSVEKGVEDPTASSYQIMTYYDRDENVIKIDQRSDTLSIGYNDGTALGTDAYRPNGALRVNKSYNIGAVDKAFRENLYEMQNTVNETEWLDWQPGEVLFLGANISYDYKVQSVGVDYSFLYGKTQGIELEILNPADKDAPFTFAWQDVKPFEYIWARYPKVPKRPKDNGNPKEGVIFTRYPTHWYRDTLYKESDFETLGLVGPT